ncbi:MAG: ribose 5-phosphate isomerase B [Bacteroidales bacterium]|nr:ribose 5-phosphate isomerase B [Bacteroidales bacterium]
MNSPIIIGSDHAGYNMKKELVKHLKKKGIKVDDIGTNSNDAVDYPDYGHKLGKMVGEGKFKMGISICGSGNGISMTTNKHAGVRGAICWNEDITEMARRHNDANICSLPARYIDLDTAKRIVDIFVETNFDGGRHEKRIKKIDI